MRNFSPGESQLETEWDCSCKCEECKVEKGCSGQCLGGIHHNLHWKSKPRMRTDLCWDASAVALCLGEREWCDKTWFIMAVAEEVSWFQLCQQSVHGHGQAILPQIFSSFIYSLLPALAACQAVLSCRTTLIHCSSVELGLSSVPCTLGSSCRTEHPWYHWAFWAGQRSLAPGVAIFPSADAPILISAGFPRAVLWGLNEIWGCSSHKQLLDSISSAFQLIRLSSNRNLRKLKFQFQEVG